MHGGGGCSKLGATEGNRIGRDDGGWVAQKWQF